MASIAQYRWVLKDIGLNLTDRAKSSSKLQLMIDRRRAATAVCILAVNCPDKYSLQELIFSMIAGQPISEQHLYLDRGYDLPTSGNYSNLKITTRTSNTDGGAAPHRSVSSSRRDTLSRSALGRRAQWATDLELARQTQEGSYPLVQESRQLFGTVTICLCRYSFQYGHGLITFSR